MEFGIQFYDNETKDVARLHDTFGFPISEDMNTPLDHKEMLSRAKFMQEELDEFVQGVLTKDLAEMADALVDLVYVAKGTAVHLGLPWGKLWRDVHHCNLKKKVGYNSNRPWMEHCLIKPTGWTPPRTLEILKENGYEPSANHS